MKWQGTRGSSLLNHVIQQGMVCLLQALLSAARHCV